MKLGFLPVRSLPVLSDMSVVYFGNAQNQQAGSHKSMIVLTLVKSLVAKD